MLGPLSSRCTVLLRGRSGVILVALFLVTTEETLRPKQCDENLLLGLAETQWRRSRSLRLAPYADRRVAAGGRISGGWTRRPACRA